jgi:hypothetical protein
MRRLELIQPCDFEPLRHAEVASDGSLRCRGCRSAVTDLSSMTAEQATAFLKSNRGGCVSFRMSRHGEIRFLDKPREPVRAGLAENARPLILVASLLAAACEPSASAAGNDASALVASDASIVSEDAQASSLVDLDGGALDGARSLVDAGRASKSKKPGIFDGLSLPPGVVAAPPVPPNKWHPNGTKPHPRVEPRRTGPEPQPEEDQPAGGKGLPY